MSQTKGGNALIHLNTSAAIKGRWVAESRKRGMKLTDYIIEMMRRAQAMNTYDASNLKDYKGAGWALAAITGGQVTRLIYLDDVAEDVIMDDNGDEYPDVKRRITLWTGTTAAGQYVRELQALGEVSIGMCSCGEFVEL